MCGIAGEFHFTEPVVATHVKCMMDALVHRGPDDEGIYCNGPIGLGHRRLSIIGLAESGRNPMWTRDRSMAIVFNGEVYNYRELRSQLKSLGYQFSSETDTEVVLNAIHCWGIETALGKFLGMFAFAVWDAHKRSLLLARDRAGIKPLFYFQSKDTLLFGSELKALYAHPHYKKRIDQRGLGQYFVLGYTLGDTTVLADTLRVPAGHYVCVESNGAIQLRQYWSLDQVKNGSFTGSFDEAAEELQRLAENAFAYRLVSDVPVGVFLSGGIDSTFLAAILKKRLNADLLHITIGFRDARYDEAPMATQIAKELGLRHEVHYLDAPDAVQALQRFSEIYDEPFGDSSGMPTSLLCGIAREHVKVALSADGGDEQFCGYESYPRYAHRYSQFSRIPRQLRRCAASVLSALPYEPFLSRRVAQRGRSRSNPRFISTVEKGVELLRVNQASDVLRIMNEKGWTQNSVGALLGTDASTLFRDTVLGPHNASDCSAGEAEMMRTMMRCDYQSFLRDDILTKVDRASMAVSLECRDPFLDHRLAEFAFALPMEYLYAPGEHKRILKHILRRYISEDILKAPKRGFVVPLYEWMKGPWRPLVLEYLSKDRIRAVGALDENLVSAEVDKFYRYEGVGAEKLLLLLNFQMWAQRWYLS